MGILKRIAMQSLAAGPVRLSLTQSLLFVQYQAVNSLSGHIQTKVKQRKRLSCSRQRPQVGLCTSGLGRGGARACCMTKSAAGTSMGVERPRISCAWCSASARKPSPRAPAVRATTASCAPTHTPSLTASVQTTATDARYCVPSRVLIRHAPWCYDCRLQGYSGSWVLEPCSQLDRLRPDHRHRRQVLRPLPRPDQARQASAPLI